MDCGDLRPLPNGAVHVINTTYQSRVNFTCENGHDLVGTLFVVCLANGTWSEAMPQCISKTHCCVIL